MEIKEPAPAYEKRKYTIEEYLELEKESDLKHEYYRGEIFAMSGPKVQHNIIAGNIFGDLKNKLKGSRCRPFSSDQRIHIPSNTLFTYPDISVVCGEINTLNNDKWNILNPCVLIEILSPSTRSYDRGEKFWFYRAIQTLKEYVIVDSENIQLEIFRVNERGHWELEEYTNTRDKLFVKTIDVYIELTEIYEGTELLQG